MVEKFWWLDFEVASHSDDVHSEEAKKVEFSCVALLLIWYRATAMD